MSRILHCFRDDQRRHQPCSSSFLLLKRPKKKKRRRRNNGRRSRAWRHARWSRPVQLGCRQARSAPRELSREFGESSRRAMAARTGRVLVLERQDHEGRRKRGKKDDVDKSDAGLGDDRDSAARGRRAEQDSFQGVGKADDDDDDERNWKKKKKKKKTKRDA